METFPEGTVSHHAGQKSHLAVWVRSADTLWGTPTHLTMCSPARPGQHLSRATLKTQQHPQPSVDSAVVTPETSHLPHEANGKRLLQSVTKERWGQFFQQAQRSGGSFYLQQKLQLLTSTTNENEPAKHRGPSAECGSRGPVNPLTWSLFLLLQNTNAADMFN